MFCRPGAAGGGCEHAKLRQWHCLFGIVPLGITIVAFLIRAVLTRTLACAKTAFVLLWGEMKPRLVRGRVGEVAYNHGSTHGWLAA